MSGNLSRWSKPCRRHYEVWYLTVHEPSKAVAYWIRYTLLVPEAPDEEGQAALWLFRFAAEEREKVLAAKKEFPLDSAILTEAPFCLSISDSVLSDDRAWGSFVTDRHQVRWDLRFEPGRAFYHLPALLRGLSRRHGGVCSPNFSVRMSGFVEVDGVKDWIRAEPGHQSHVWGPAYPDGWFWAHSNAFEQDPEAGLEILSTQSRFVGMPLSATLGVLRTAKRDHLFNSAASLARNGVRYEPGCLEFSCKSLGKRLYGKVSFRPEWLAGVVYTGPLGEKRYCYNTEIASCEVELAGPRAGLNSLARWSSRSGCAFEIVSSEPLAGLPLHLC